MTKSKGTSQKLCGKERPLSNEWKTSGSRCCKEDRQINFHQSRNLESHNKFPIMADRFTLQADNKVLLNEVSFQMPLGKNCNFG